MTRGDLNKWQVDLDSLEGIYIFPGSEGLWVIISLIFLIWFIMAIYKIEANENLKIEEELGKPKDLESFLSSLEAEEKKDQ
tara:strand:+ start:824 stop:1066 length:243 start_codon:yes stop_codon:yes gene_type:complete